MRPEFLKPGDTIGVMAIASAPSQAQLAANAEPAEPVKEYAPIKPDIEFEDFEKIDLRVEVRGAEIVVFVDGAETLRYVDDAPFVAGRVGVRACDAALKVDRLSVAPLE